MYWVYGSVVVELLQAVRSQVSFPKRSLDFSIDLPFPDALWS